MRVAPPTPLLTPLPVSPAVSGGARPPAHLTTWHLPRGWQWHPEAVAQDDRHYQALIDGFGRAVSLVTTDRPEWTAWLAAEARALAHHTHPVIPTTYTYWDSEDGAPRGPGYVRRWLAGEPLAARLRRGGPITVPRTLDIFRQIGSALTYLHDKHVTHGAISPAHIWLTPTGRVWLLGWQWALPTGDRPPDRRPDAHWCRWPTPAASPTPVTDVWQLATLCISAMTGRPYDPTEIVPVQTLRPDCPRRVADILDEACQDDERRRDGTAADLLRAMERAVGGRTTLFVGEAVPAAAAMSDDHRLRWALGDDYDVLALIGQGTFGSVWRVRDLTLGREVALKMLHPTVVQDAAVVSRFLHEARLAVQLAHPGIVPVFDFDQRGDVIWYTMDLAEGGSLADRVASHGPLPWADCRVQIAPVLDAMVAAHAAGVVHRDLKPENILIDRHQQWRIADFGIARADHAAPTSTSGTPTFAAPEQLLGEPHGPPADCFGLAAILTFALTGRPPFAPAEPRVLLARMLTTPPRLETVLPAVAAWLRRALHPDPDQRYQDAAAMRDAWLALPDAP